MSTGRQFVTEINAGRPFTIQEVKDYLKNEPVDFVDRHSIHRAHLLQLIDKSCSELDDIVREHNLTEKMRLKNSSDCGKRISALLFNHRTDICILIDKGDLRLIAFGHIKNSDAILQLVKQEWHQDFIEFCFTGEASNEFFQYADCDRSCQEAITAVMNYQAKRFEELAKFINKKSSRK